jgi:hypothetical protein
VASATARSTARTTSRSARLFGATLALVAAAALAAGPAFAGQEGKDKGQPDIPKGNSGVVKLDGTPFDDHPDNQPHVGCIFQVDLTGFPAGHGPVTVTFTAQHPTGDGQQLESGVMALAQGAHGLGASRTFTLDFDGISPHPKQGFHVKVTVDTGRGAGKHKVFWVRGCGTPPTSSTAGHGSTTSTTEDEQEESSTSVTSTTAPEDEDESAPATTAAPTTTALAAGAGGQTPGGGSSLPFTGADSTRLLAIGTLLLLAGALLLWAGRLRAARTAATQQSDER